MSEGTTTPRSLSDLPDDELITYASDLGLELDLGTPRGELLRRIRGRQELLLELDRDAMLDVVVWARQPVRKSASKESLARQIAQVQSANFDELSDRGLRTLARLRAVKVGRDEPRNAIERRLRKAEGLSAKLRRMRRAVAGRLIARAVRRQGHGEYQFLPEDDAVSLKEQIQADGVVGGIARKLRGVADDYVREKLDEIERRIDRKLDEIDHRLGEWRDREITNRLRILKLTLLFSILVAALSLGYDCVTGRVGPEAGPKPVNRTAVVEGDPAETDHQESSAEASKRDDVREVQPTR